MMKPLNLKWTGIILLPCLMAQLCIAGVASNLPFNEGFEDDGNGSRYSLSSQFFDLLNGIFDQTTDLTHGYDGPYTGQQGVGIFASEDTDDAAGSGADEQTLVFIISIAGNTNLMFDALFAAGALSTYDIDDYIIVEAQIDGGLIQTILAFESNDALIGSRPIAHDADLDGVGEGAVLGFEFQRFAAPIAGAGNQLLVRIRIQADSGFESLALDDINITAGTNPDSVDEVTVSPDGNTAEVSSTGAPGRTYRVQSTDSLTPANWQTRATIKADFAGQINYADPGPVPPYRVYRTVYP